MANPATYDELITQHLTKLREAQKLIDTGFEQTYDTLRSFQKHLAVGKVEQNPQVEEVLRQLEEATKQNATGGKHFSEANEQIMKEASEQAEHNENENDAKEFQEFLKEAEKRKEKLDQIQARLEANAKKRAELWDGTNGYVGSGGMDDGAFGAIALQGETLDTADEKLEDLPSLADLRSQLDEMQNRLGVKKQNASAVNYNMPFIPPIGVTTGDYWQTKGTLHEQLMQQYLYLQAQQNTLREQLSREAQEQAQARASARAGNVATTQQHSAQE